MNIITKQFNTRYVNLNSDLDVETLDAEFRKFCDRSFWNFSVNLSGRLRSDGLYSFSRKWEIGTISNTGGMPKLRAKVVPLAKGSLIEVTMPVSLGSVFVTIIAFVIGLLILCSGFFADHADGSTFVLGLIFMLMLPAGIAYQNKWKRNKLLSTFADVFGLYQA